MHIEYELENMRENVVEMGNQVIAVHRRLIQTLQEPDREKELDIIACDEYINRMEEEINDNAQRALALLTPVAKDLRQLLAGVKIASELERIGDYAKNIAKQLIKQETLPKSAVEYSIAMEEKMLEMLQKTLKAYQDNEHRICFEIAGMDQEINQLMRELRQKLIDDETLGRHELFMTASMLRSLERSGDHVKNICEHIIYMVKDQHYDFG